MDAAPSAPRRLAGALVLGVCGLLLVRCFLLEPYEVPTGSMAPAIAGRHRAVRCPRCGCRVVVGRDPAEDGDGRARPGWYARACCPNCGCDRLELGRAPEAAGDQLLVSKSAFLFRAPCRWEVIVFRLFGKVFIKRLIGLAGEWIEIRDGDVCVNRRLARKTLDEARAMRILVFDNDCPPGPGGWRPRWEVPAGQAGPHPLAGTELRLDGTGPEGGSQVVTYRHYLLDEKKCQPVRDEYSYNGADRRAAVPVHDFLLECDVAVEAGSGHVVLGLADGRDTVLAEIPAGGDGPGQLVLRPPAEAEAETAGLASPAQSPGAVYTIAAAEPLRPGRVYHLEMAFVDRRVSLAIDGRSTVPPVDLPPATGRPGVDRPALLGARGVRVVVRHFRLYRDVHYTQVGRNAVQGKAVHLGSGQYFVLGDNSPSSDDSRFWPDGGSVPADCLVGKPFLVHLPTRIATWELFGRRWQARIPDWGRMRWLR
jgi:signal peptidase I